MPTAFVPLLPSRPRISLVSPSPASSFTPFLYVRLLRTGGLRQRTSLSPRAHVPTASSAAPGNGSGSSAEEGFPAAFESSLELREGLERIARDRSEQAQRTEESLANMSEQLEEIMAKIRAEAGMPPVASPPKLPSTSELAETAAVEAAEASAGAATEASVGEASSPVNAFSDDSSDDPYMDPSNFGIASAAGWQVLASENHLPQVDESGVKFRIECDKDGCSIIELQGDSPAGPGVRSQFLESGPGFRVGYDPDGPPAFCATVGSAEWLLALSRDEIRHFKRLTLAMQKKMDRIAKGLDTAPEQKASVRRSGDGMFNERVARAGSDCSVELESKLLWVQAFGSPESGQYSIRTIFMEGRQCEGYWAKQHVQGLLAAVARLQI